MRSASDPCVLPDGLELKLAKRHRCAPGTAREATTALQDPRSQRKSHVDHPPCTAQRYVHTGAVVRYSCYCPCLTEAFIHAVHHCIVLRYVQGTDVRLMVGPGSFSTPVTDPEVNRWGQAPCPAGSYCVHGVRALCPGGRFGNATSMTSPACSGPCFAGHYCPPGATSPDQFQCGTIAVYCPLGSAAPSQALPGEYTTGGVCASTRSAAAPCPSGSYCINGTVEPCPAGRFGCADRLSDIGCNGPCVRAETLLLQACTQTVTQYFCAVWWVYHCLFCLVCVGRCAQPTHPCA